MQQISCAVCCPKFSWAFFYFFRYCLILIVSQCLIIVGVCNCKAGWVREAQGRFNMFKSPKTFFFLINFILKQLRHLLSFLGSILNNHRIVRCCFFYAGEKLEPLYAPIRHKIANALTNWHPSDASAKIILEPWHGVFRPGHMSAFLVKNILPKLELEMRSLAINPHQQYLGTLAVSLGTIFFSSF